MKSQNLALWTKNEIHILDKIWMENAQLIAEKIVKLFHIYWRYHNAFTVGLKEWMPRIIGMRMDFLSENE